MKISLWPHAKPKFIIIGAQKAGTTSLYSYLSQHPCIIPARLKEVHYFDYNYHRGMRWYLRRFPTLWRMWRAGRPLGARVITGEASPCYMLYPNTPRRIRETLPDVKLIALLRNPVDRAFSQYQMNITKEAVFSKEKQCEVPRESLSFEDALEQEDDRIANALQRLELDENDRGQWLQMHSYKTRGLYAKQLKHWLEYFPREQFLILDSGQLSKNTAVTCSEVVRYLDLPEWIPQTFQRRHEGRYKEAMKTETRARLVEYFRPHNEELYELLGTRFDWDK